MSAPVIVMAVKRSGDAPLSFGGASMIATGQTLVTPVMLLILLTSAAEASIDRPFHSESNA